MINITWIDIPTKVIQSHVPRTVVDWREFDFPVTLRGENVFLYVDVSIVVGYYDGYDLCPVNVTSNYDMAEPGFTDCPTKYAVIPPEMYPKEL